MFSPLTASEEKTNGTRLARLLIDGGTNILRQVLHSNIPPATTLQIWLKNNYPKLQGLKLFNSQKEKLFPSSGDPPDSNTFDITLLHLLLREICGLSAPSTGWHNMPADSDASHEANIVRIKCYRNELCHSVSTGIPNAEFEDKWKKVAKASVDLGFDPAEITRLKNEDIDHDTQRRVEEEVNKWKLDIEPRVEELEKGFEQIITGKISILHRSISAGATRELTNCLPDKISDVFGRTEEIKQVTKAIQEGEMAAVIITGGPGFGKTTVANNVAHELVASQEYKTAVMFCSLRSKAKITDVATSLILACSKNLSQPPENPQHWLLNWSKQQEQRVTFVLDNADDILESDDRSQFVGILRDMRNLSGRNVNFVVTSGKAFTDPNMTTTELRLNSLCPEDAKNVLLQFAYQNTPQTLTRTAELVELCNRVPLALCIVGSLLSDYPEDELIKSLKEKPLEVLRQDERDENSVEKAIKTSFDFLSKPEQEALVLMSVVPGSFHCDAAKAILTRRCIDSQSITLLRSLKNRSLLEQHTTGSYRYEIHSLIQNYATKIGQEKMPDLLQQGVELACDHFMSRLASNADIYWSKDKCKESLESFNKDRPNFEYFLHDCVPVMKDKAQPLVETMRERLVHKLSQKCMYLEMCLLPSVYVQILEEFLHLVFASDEYVCKRVELLCLLGHESRKVGNRDKYKECLEEAIREHSQNALEFNKEKVSEAFFLNNYARFLSEQRKPNEPKEQYDIALKICEELPQEDYVQKAVTLLFAGREDNHRNERDDAEGKLDEALSLFKRNLGDHIMTALLLKDLADFHLFHGDKILGSERDQKRSIELYTESLEMMERLGMKDHKECILTLTNLGICWHFQGNMEEAMKLFEESLYIAERELEADHRWKIYVKTQMAFWWKKMGDMGKAKALKDEAMQMSDRLQLPDNQPPNKFLLQKI